MGQTRVSSGRDRATEAEPPMAVVVVVVAFMRPSGSSFVHGTHAGRARDPYARVELGRAAGPCREDRTLSARRVLLAGLLHLPLRVERRRESRPFLAAA